MSKNLERAAFAMKALTRYWNSANADGIEGNVESAITDLLIDLRHLANTYNNDAEIMTLEMLRNGEERIDFDFLNENARFGFWEECDEERLLDMAINEPVGI